MLYEPTAIFLEFQRSCLAHGLSSARMLRYLNDLPRVAKKLKKDFEKVKKSDIEAIMAEIEKLEEAIIHYAEKESIDVVFGSNNKIRIKTSQRYSCPSKHSKEREKLEQLLREYGKWEDVAQLDTTAINNIIQEKKWDNELIDALKDYFIVNYCTLTYSY